jgi:hypothetical protein
MSPRRNWNSPDPSLANECASPLEPKGGGAPSPAGEGLGESQFRRLEKKLSTLPILCAMTDQTSLRLASQLEMEAAMSFIYNSFLEDILCSLPLFFRFRFYCYMYIYNLEGTEHNYFS